MDIKFNEAGMRDLYRQVAQKIESTDQQFRRTWGGKPAAEVEKHVAAAFGQIGVNLPDYDVKAYAAAVSAGEKFVWKLK